MKGFLFAIILGGSILGFAQTAPIDSSSFKDCIDLSNEKLEDCFFSNLYKALYENYEQPQELTSIASREYVILNFKINRQGKFIPIDLSSRLNAYKEAVENAFKKLPRVAPPILNDDYYSKQFVLELTVPMVENGAFKIYNFTAAEKREDQIVEIVEVEEVFENSARPKKIPFAIVETVPQYPGCENLGTNNDSKKCTHKKMEDFVKSNFNKEIARELGLQGRIKIAAMFEIDEKGTIGNVQIRASHRELEQEMESVIKKLPQMTPGMQRDKQVKVIYALPYVFNVDDE